MNLLYIDEILDVKTGISKKTGKPWVKTKFVGIKEDQTKITVGTFSSIKPKTLYEGELTQNDYGWQFDSKGEFDDAGSQEETPAKTATPPPPAKTTPPATQPSTTTRETALKCAILYFSKDIPKVPTVSDKDIITTAQTFLNWLREK